MPGFIPFIPSENNYKLGVPLGSGTYYFDTRWNEMDNIDPDTGKASGAWYFDLYDEKNNVIAIGVKVVLGRLGRACSHPFFATNILQAVEAENTGREASYDDLGGRVQVLHMTLDEFRRGDRA